MSLDQVINFVDAPGFANYKFKKLSPEVQHLVATNHKSEFLNRPISENPSEAEIAACAIKKLKQLGVDFGDLRLSRENDRVVYVSDTNIAHNAIAESAGIGIRALVRGYWGFAATSTLNLASIEQCVVRAVALAQGAANTFPQDKAINMAHWAHEPAHLATFHTPIGICPFATSVEDVAKPMLQAANYALKCEGIKTVRGSFRATGFRRIFASTDGAYIETSHAIVNVELKVIAVANSTSAYRTLVSPAMAGGLEHYFEADFAEKIEGTCKDAISKCHASTPSAGKYTLILDGHHLALTMHESVGHPTELDRVLGYELSLAGGSFAGLDKLGHFQYGSPIVNFTGDNRIRFGAASQGFDDEGVACQRFPIIKEGIFVGYGTNRETAHRIGQKRANGTCRASSWSDTPIVRIPNLFLEPGHNKLSLNDLIADTKDGILMLGRDSFSIDQMRYNFQFGADMCYRIKNGSIQEPLNNVIYQSITPEFWNSCDAICDASEWQMHGVMNCGKGHPMQVSRMMHGAAPARFQNISVGY